MSIKPAISWIFVSLSASIAVVLILQFFLRTAMGSYSSFTPSLVVLLVVAASGFAASPDFRNTTNALAFGLLCGLAIFVIQLYQIPGKDGEVMRYIFLRDYEVGMGRPYALMDAQIFGFGTVAYIFVGCATYAGGVIGLAKGIIERQRARERIRRRR